MNVYEDKLAKALGLFNDGFASQAQKKRVNDLLLVAYEFVVDELRLAIRNQTEPEIHHKTKPLSDLYFSIPSLRHWKDKHSLMFKDYPEHLARITRIVSLRSATKNAELTPINSNERKRACRLETEKVQSSLSALIDKKQGQYIEGLRVAHLFNGLDVTVNSHQVTNYQGTEFTRHFYYLNGQLTALNLIIAIAYGFDDHNKTKS